MAVENQAALESNTLQFPDLDEKIKHNTLLLKDITDKALSINIALHDKFPDHPDFRNPIIQGYAAWLIMYDYLCKNQDKLDKDILEFLTTTNSEKISISNILQKTSEALKKDFKARIRDDINKLNEAEIMTRSIDGRIYNYYTEEQKTNIVNLLKNKNLLDEEGNFKIVFYLVYRERDGRFFCVAEKDIEIARELNINLPPIGEIKSTHITLNEGQNSKDIFEKNFKSCATYQLPCKVDSKDSLLYCGIKFEDVELNQDQMYQLELCKNPPVEKVNILQIKGSICKFKENLKFPIPERVVPLHITIGVTPRKMALEISSSDKKSVLDFINSNNPFIKPLAKNIKKQEASYKNTYGSLFQSIEGEKNTIPVAPSSGVSQQPSPNLSGGIHNNYS